MMTDESRYRSIFERKFVSSFRVFKSWYRIQKMCCQPGSSLTEYIAIRRCIHSTSYSAYRNRSLLRNLRKTRRQKARLQRMRQRLLRKLQKSKSRKTKGKKKIADSECSPDERLNCFSHDNDHWKTAPFWSDGPFCACTGSNTNTYSCVRNVNATHNYLYCEFVSGLITYYNLNVDPFQLRNIYLTLSTEELNFMHHQLAVLKNQGLAYSRNYGNRAVARQRSFIQRYGTYSNTNLNSL